MFGTVHILYLEITVPLSVLGLLLAKKYAKTEKAQSIVLKSLGGLLLVWIIINRLSQVYRYSDVRWEQIIPDSFCGMTSLVLALSVLFGKKDNCVYHFTWFLGLIGALITVFNPTFLDQGPSVFYLPTISGLSAGENFPAGVKRHPAADIGGLYPWKFKQTANAENSIFSVLMSS